MEFIHWLPLIMFQFHIQPGMDPDINPDEEEEKRRLINQVLELQNTLDGEWSASADFVICSTLISLKLVNLGIWKRQRICLIFFLFARKVYTPSQLNNK